MRVNFFNNSYSTIGKAILASSLLVFYAYGADFKIDLSEKISNEAKKKIIDGAEKKKISLELLNNIKIIDPEVFIDKVIKLNVLSTDYTNGKLIVKYNLKLDPVEAANYLRVIGEVSKIDFKNLSDWNSKPGTSYTQNTDNFLPMFLDGDLNSKVNAGSIGYLQWWEFDFLYNIKFALLTENGEPLKTTYIEAPYIFQIQKGNINLTGSNLSAEVIISAQDAAKIKSIQLRFTTRQGDDNAANLARSLVKIKKARDALLLSPQTSEPILSFDIAREKLLLSFKDLFYWWDLAKRNEGADATRITGQISHLMLHNLYIAKIIEISALQTIIENNSFNNSEATLSDLSSIFSIDKLNSVGQGGYKVKYRSDAEVGCQKYISKDFKFDNPAKGFGFDGGNEVNSLMNQMGMANNSVVLGSPDQKIRVITGFISSLTENGGIISNGNTMKDANPIQFTKNAKTVIFNPEKVTVGKSLVRIVGTYDQNSKIKLTNGFGGTKIVDAANINVTCIEGMQSSDEMMQNMYKMLGIMK